MNLRSYKSVKLTDSLSITQVMPDLRPVGHSGKYSARSGATGSLFGHVNGSKMERKHKSISDLLNIVAKLNRCEKLIPKVAGSVSCVDDRFSRAEQISLPPLGKLRPLKGTKSKAKTRKDSTRQTSKARRSGKMFRYYC